MTDLDARIARVVAQVVALAGGAVEKVEPQHHLTDDLGLDSLGIAQLVAELELELKVDPFAKRAFRGIRTVAELTEVYRAHLKG